MPSRSLKTNLVLAALLVGLSVFAYVYEFKNKTTREQQAEAKTRLIQIQRDAEFERVQILAKQGEINVDVQCLDKCKLTDTQSKWELVAPVKFKADEANVGTFLTTLTSSTILETLPFEGDREQFLSRYGLAKDKRDAYKVTIKLKSYPNPFIVYVGDTAAVGDSLYVYVEGPEYKNDGIHLIAGHVRTNIERNLSYWRSKRIVEYAVQDISSLKYTNSDGTVELSKQGASWYLSGNRLADNEAVETFLTGLIYMNAQEYVSDNKSKDGGKLGVTRKPKYTVSVKTSKGEETSLQLFAPADAGTDKNKLRKLYVTVSGKDFIAQIDATGSEKFGKKPEAFRYRNLLTLAEKTGAESIDVGLSDKVALSFIREAGSWKLAKGTVDKYDPFQVDRALTRIGAARIVEFSGKKAPPAGSTLVSSWVIKGRKGADVRSFSIYVGKDKSNYYAKLSDGELAVLERGSGSAVPKVASDFSKPLPSPTPTMVPSPSPKQGH